MTVERFKEIEERNRHNPIVLCYNYFIEEKNSKISLQDFQNNFSMWLAIQTFGNVSGGLNTVVEYLKNKHK